MPAKSSLPLSFNTSCTSCAIIPYYDTTPPYGWSLCDGQDGRPDLRGRFILGASNQYILGSYGGEFEKSNT